jgi:glycosyltransferase involved in cell wall biosynthesis
MRVGIDARYAFRRQRRGIGRYVAALLTHLPAVAAAEDRFVLYVDGPADLEALAVVDPRFQVRRVPVGNPLLFEEVALPRAAAADGLDLLHLTSNYGPSFPPCPTVYTVHDLIEWLRPGFSPARLSFRHGAGRAVRMRTLPRQARRARRVITISTASRDDLVRLLHLPPERIAVVPLGVDANLAPMDPGEARALLRAEGQPVPDRYVLALGALDPRKNGPLLMRAFARAQPALGDCQLWIVGVERVRDYALPFPAPPPWLRVQGFVERATLVHLMQGASAFAFPSLYEGFGLPVLEAMACGVPVLASRRSSVPEVAGDAALLFDPEDEAALAADLERLLSDRGLQDEFRRRGPVRAAAFTWAETARQTMAVYRGAVTGG